MTREALSEILIRYMSQNNDGYPPPSGGWGAQQQQQGQGWNTSQPGQELQQHAPGQVAQTINCPFCMELIHPQAKKCRHCNETLDVTLRAAQEAQRSSHGGGQPNIVINNQANAYAGGYGMVQYSPKSKGVCLALSLIPPFFGLCGIHRIYAGKIGTGLLQLFTFGGLLIWQLIDVIALFAGSFKDGNGQPVN